MDREMYRMLRETHLLMLLRYEDRNSMAFSMEARVPFLDHRVVEFCHGLSYRYKMRDGLTKWVLRQAYNDLLPEAVRERQDKLGFPTPVAVWFRGDLATELTHRLENAVFYDAKLINRLEVRRILEQHLSGAMNHERTLFRLLTLDMWLRQHASLLPF